MHKEMKRRYSRQLSLPKFNISNQEQLAQSQIIIIGIGGLGCPLLQYTAAAGIKKFVLFDADSVEINNLNRQIIYQQQHIGQHKTDCAAAWLAAFNADAQVITHCARLDENNIETLDNYNGLIVDCSDNIETRYLISDYCASRNRQFIHASIQQSAFLCAAFAPQQNGCLRCMFPQAAFDMTPSCTVGGTLGAWTGIVGAWQAHLVIQLLSGQQLDDDSRVLYGDISQSQVCNIKYSSSQSQCHLCHTYQQQGQSAAINEFQKQLKQLRINEISWKRLINNHIQNNTLIVDLRNALENEKTPLGADIRIDVNQYDKEKFIANLLTSIPDNTKDLVFVCASGLRSKRAAQWMNQFGEYKVASLKNGVEALSADQLQQFYAQQKIQRRIHDTA